MGPMVQSKGPTPHKRSVARAAGRFFVVGFVAVAATSLIAQDARLEMSCSAISNRMTVTDLRQKYGDANVREVADAGDGKPGAILFAEAPDKRIDLVWTDASRTKLASFMAWGPKSVWRIPQGIKSGQAIADVTDLNGRAFILRGFSQPDAGAVVSWMGGKLAELDAGSCHVAVRLTPPPAITFTTLDWRLAEIVQDAVEVSSDDRRIKPYKAAVSALGLEWR